MSQLEQVKQLRERTGAGISDCKLALDEAKGDLERAIEILRAKGIAKAAKKAGREASQGVVQSYIHGGGRIGVLIEVNCETDFVARNDEFKAFVHEVAMQIAAMAPLAVSEEGIDPALIEKERNIAREQTLAEGKKPEMVDKIVEGRIKKYLKENSLLNQEYIRDAKRTINDLLQETIAKIGENIVIRRFVRFELGGQ